MFVNSVSKDYKMRFVLEQIPTDGRQSKDHGKSTYNKQLQFYTQLENGTGTYMILVSTDFDWMLPAGDRPNHWAALS